MGVFILTGEFSSANFVLSTKLEESHSQPEKDNAYENKNIYSLPAGPLPEYNPGLRIRSGRLPGQCRFLTDRMAFELHLNSNQYNDLYEINYDFLCKYRSIRFWHCRCRHSCDGMHITVTWTNETTTCDGYFHKPNTYASSILNISSVPFMPSITYAICVCIKIYPNRTHFYFGPPRHYLTYRGGHCRAHFGGVSYYRRNYPARYHHPVYSRPCRVSPQMRPHDFAGPRPGNRPPQSQLET